VATVLAFMAGFVAPAHASHRARTPGGIGLRLVDVPIDAGSDPRAQIYIVDHLAPGTIIHRRIDVSNTSDSTARIALYAGAASISNGSFLGAAGQSQNELSTWTSVYPTSVEVAAGDSVMALVSIAVPSDAAPGEQYGVVWAEVRSAPTASSGIIQVSRVGIRIYLSVGPGGPPASNFTIDSVTAERSSDGQPMILATVRNTGGRALDMSGTLQLLAGPGGLSAGPFAADLGTTLAIGDTEPVTFVLDKQVPAGPWDARITLRSGLLERSAQATVTFPEIGASTPVNTTSMRAGWLYPAVAGLVGLLVLGVGLLVVIARRPDVRRRRSSGTHRQLRRETQWR
jgi:hypothetical protein